ncbi:MAG: RluA family pseudouridine synthase [Saprospiraceae bacterium]|nr:RluA family pseudouridine synthase [Saprospiraceae bacterium]
MLIETHIVPSISEAQRLSDYLCGVFPQLPSRKSVKNAIRAGLVFVDGKKGYTGDWVISDQKIELYELDQTPTKIYKYKIKVVYEDEDIAIVNKPAGISVSGNQFRTVENALLYNLIPSKKIDAFKKPRPVHRLDNQTSGLLLIAKTKQARIHLGEQFEKRSIRKNYKAIVIGQPNSNGKINFDINGKPSISVFELERTVRSLKNNYLSLLNLYPLTGRTHQLRIHLSKIGFPILGDKLYGQEGLILKGKGLFLAAVSLEFIHPITESSQLIQIKMPNKFEAILEREQRRFDVFYSENK